MAHPNSGKVCCATCPYFNPIKTAETGHCRLHGPNIDAEYRFGETFYPVWPTTGRELWCGDHPDFHFAMGNRREAL